jgi:hypothetical protein
LAEPPKSTLSGARVLCVIGMHRSGTSCLAGTLEEAGLHLGEVITVAPHNRKGNRENPRIMALHEQVLVHSGGSWDRPPPDVRWADEHRRERDAIIASYGDRPRWGFKCPRTLFTLEGWREALDDLTFVGTFRHPVPVADSLIRRNGGEREQWIDLWVRYNEKLLALHERSAMPLVCFDWSPAEYLQKVVALIERLELTVPEQLAFFDPELRHESASEFRLSSRAAELYARLRAAAAEQ